MTGTLVLTFDEYREPAARLARELDAPMEVVEVHRFPDGEARVRLPEALPERVVVVRSLDRPDEKLIELMLAAETARTLGAARLELVAPYLCYMRQDVAFRPGEAVSQRVVGALLGRLFDRVVTVDPHLHRTHDLGEVVPGAEAVVMTAAVPLADFVSEAAPGALLVGPDEESEQWVSVIGERAGLEWAVAVKERRGDAEVRVTLPGRDYDGRDVVLVDDMVSTGGSLIAAARALLESGARSVSALVTHGLFCGDALDRLRAAGVADVWSTDAVPNPTARVELARLLASALD